MMTTTNAALSSLAVSAGSIYPPLSAKRTAYGLLLGHEVQTLTVTASADAGLPLTVQGRSVASGEPGQQIALEPGRNLIEIVVGTDAAARRYHVAAIRAHPAPTWRQVAASAPWPARDSAGELVFNDHLWLFGGYTPEVVNDVWRSPDGVQWEQMPPIPCDSGVNIPIRFVHQGRMWIASQRGALFNSADGRQWTLVSDRAPWAGRKTAGSAVFGGRMWVLGGLQNKRRHNDVWSSADGVNWTQELAEAPWSRRQLWDNLVVFRDQLWIVGGGAQQYHPFKAYTDVWRSPDGRHWEQVTDDAPWPARVWNSCLAWRDRLWMFAGYRSEPAPINFNDVWYSADGANWRQLQTPQIWSPRHEVSPYVFRDKLWVVAGNAWPLMNDTWQLDIPGLTFLTQPVVEETAGELYIYRARADFHRSGGPLSYRLVEGPPWLSMDAARGVLRGTPPQSGVARVAIEVSDGAETARQNFDLHVP